MNKVKPGFQLCLGVVKALAFSVYVFLLYQLLLIPAILDWSLYGIALSIGIVVLLVWAIPSVYRKRWVVLAVVFLLALKALNNLLDSSLTWQIAGALIIFVVLLITGVLAGNLRLRHFAPVFLVASILTFTIDLTEIPYWSEFAVKWKSPLLYPKQTSVDYFPLHTLDLDGDGKRELVVQGNLEEAKKFIAQDKKINFQYYGTEENQFLVYKQTKNGSFELLQPEAYDPKALVSGLKPDYPLFPYFEVHWDYSSDQGLTQTLEPKLSRTEIIELINNFGMVPFTTLELSLNSIETRQKGLAALHKELGLPDQLSAATLDYRDELIMNGEPVKNLRLEGFTLSGNYGGEEFNLPAKSSGILTAGNIYSGHKATLLLGRSMQAVGLEGPEKGTILGELDSRMISDIGTAEVLVADVTQNGTDEILLNTKEAKILTLNKDGQWEVIWNSRDDSFRFEDFNTLGKSEKPEIIALSKSVVRDNPTRYITGYELTPQGLKTTWRVFTGLINLQTADFDGSGQRDLAGYMYKGHRVFVLEKHNIPVNLLLYAITGLLVAFGAYKRLSNRTRKGGGINGA